MKAGMTGRYRSSDAMSVPAPNVHSGLLDVAAEVAIGIIF
jgi:hypothetical protein